jgi:hypothetical protein
MMARMDRRNMLRQQLARAERHVAEGHEILERQRQLITRMHELGLDTTEYAGRLARFEATQAAHIADRDRLMQELAALEVSY